MAHRVAASTQFPPAQFRDELVATARALCAPGKGLLAADESTGTIAKRFEKIHVDNNETNRRNYRELLFRSEGISNYCSGAILYEETLNQNAADGTPLVDLLNKQGIIPGIKVDLGAVPLPGGNDGETLTQGFDGLSGRCAKYYAKGARFAKWRAVLKIDAVSPSDVAVQENAHGLALYSAICQLNGLVPIVEPEVLMDGEHSIETCALITQRVWEVTIKALHDQHVFFEGILLKPNMVTAGSEFKGQAPTPADSAYYTVRTLLRTIPPAIPGIMFLSGGQSEEEATVLLNAINVHAQKVKVPWALSFSYGRALQASCLKAWQGKEENVAAGQAALLTRAKANSEAALGKYVSSNSSASANESLYVKDYKY